MNDRAVHLNDASAFVGALARCRFGPGCQPVLPEHLRQIRQQAELSRFFLEDALADQLSLEGAALGGDHQMMARYMKGAQHVTNSAEVRAAAESAANAEGMSHYRLATSYFSAGYFSLRQAIEIDALRYAIDSLGDLVSRDSLIAALMVAMSRVMNAPGHSAQYLKASGPVGARRVEQAWRKSVTALFFGDALSAVEPLGLASWRSGNSITTQPAHFLLESICYGSAGVIYADPPYTRDQYARFYHVYETLYRYDFPRTSGVGRVRDERFSTGFSLKSRVAESFSQLFRQARKHDVPLVVSYPSDGLLSKVGSTPAEIASDFYGRVKVLSIESTLSTMGGRRGGRSIPTMEQITICEP